MPRKIIPLIVLGIFLLALPAFSADAAKAPADAALYAKVAALFAEEDMRSFLLEEHREDFLWQEQMWRCAQNPDARLFYLARLAYSAYLYDSWEPWPQLGAEMLLTGGPVKDSWFNEFTFSANPDGTTLATANFSPDANLTWHKTYLTRPAPDYSLWCLETEISSDSDESIINTDIMRFYNGKIYYLTPVSPEGPDFFKNNAMPQLTPADKAAALAKFGVDLDSYAMGVYFAADTTVAPFKIRAVMYQVNSSHDDPAYLCVPQCYVEYDWNGEKYVPGKKVCVDDNSWGIKLPD